MKSPLRLLIAAGPIVSLGLCLATLLLWLRSYESYPSAAIASAHRSWHAGLRQGELCLTCASGWPTPEDARRAARTAPAARPLAVTVRLGFVEQSRDSLLDHAAFLRRRLGAGEPEAAAEERLARTLEPRLHEALVARVGGPPAEPVILERAPEVHARWGFRSERAAARFPMRADDVGGGDVIAYGPPVRLAAVAVPCGVPVALFAAWPVALLANACRRGIAARRRARVGRCRACGYDLRATGDAAGPRLDRCPECGTPATAAAAVGLLILLAAGRASAADATTTAPVGLPDDPAARALVLANERSRDRLPAFEAVLTVMDPYVQPEPFDVVYRAKGNSRYMFGPAETGRPGRPTQVVLNDAYLAAWQEGDRQAYQFEFESVPRPVEPSGDSENGLYTAAGLLRLDPLSFAYNPLDRLRPALARSKVIRYSASEGTDAAGRRVARLHIKRASGPDSVEWVYDLDPQRGHAITRLATYTDDSGEPEAQRLVDLQPAGDGWVPKRIRTILRNDDPSVRRIRHNLDVRLTSVGNVPDATFRMDALELPAGVSMQRTTRFGVKESMALHDGIWVPMGAVPMRPGATVPQSTLPKWAWPAAVVVAGPLWVLGIWLMRRRFATR